MIVIHFTRKQLKLRQVFWTFPDLVGPFHHHNFTSLPLTLGPTTEISFHLTPLASVSNSFGFHSQVCLFLKRGASQTEVDEQGHDPLSIAVQTANADIVTL